MRPLLSLCLAPLLLGSGCGADHPDALSRYGRGHQIMPFDAYTVPGLTLYRILIVDAADLDATWVVGVEAESGRLVEGAPLFLRMRAGLEPPELARRALDTLLRREGRSPLMPGERRGRPRSEAEWALVQAPRVEGGTLSFWALRGEMVPQLVRYRVDLETGRVEATPASELLPPAPPEAEGEVSCEPIPSCGCWRGCARVVADGDCVRVLDGPRAGSRLCRQEDCVTSGGARTCLRVCDSDRPDASCRDALATEEGCAASCRPSEAPFHCELAGDGCLRVAHPRRAAGARARPLDAPPP